MIRTDAGLKATREAVANLEEALLALTRKRSEYHPKTFALLATPIAAEIRARRAEIDEYIGLLEVSQESTGNGGPQAPSDGVASAPTATDPNSMG
jgi:hypothetical protein